MIWNYLDHPPRMHRSRHRRCLPLCKNTVCGLDHGATGLSTKGTGPRPPGRRGSQWCVVSSSERDLV